MRYKKILLVSAYSLLLTLLAHGQENEFSALQGPYLGQAPPGMTGEVFARGIVTTADHEHSRLEFSRDGRLMFWSAKPLPPASGDQRLLFVERTKEGWTDPAQPEFLDNPNCGSPTFSADGQTFYYITRDLRSAQDERPGRQLVWQVKRRGVEWGEPRLVEDLLPVFPGKVTMAFCFAGSGNLYFDAGGPDETGAWSWDIYVREFEDDEYGVPHKLGCGINTSQINWCPYVSLDESYLIFSSDRTGPEEFGDLYICFRDGTGNWLEPVDMGPAVNTTAQERFPSVSPDGKYFFFARNMEKTHSDIFWVETKIFEKLRSPDVE